MKKKTIKKVGKKKTTKKTVKKPALSASRRIQRGKPIRRNDIAMEGKKEKLVLVGIVTHYYDKIKVAIFKVKSPIQVGQKLRFTNVDGIIFEQPIVSMQINHESVKKSKKGAIIGMKVKKQVHENNKIYLIK